MAELYPWFVFAHLIGLVLFAACHGASMFMAFRIRRERDPRTIATILDMGRLANGPMYVGLLLLAVGGLAAAWTNALFDDLWVIASIVVFIAVVVVMYAVASPFYMGLRKSLAEPGPDGAPTISSEQLAAQLDNRRPEILLAAGSIGFAVLIWLMVVKPAW
jgi:hypothetical protein